MDISAAWPSSLVVNWPKGQQGLGVAPRKPPTGLAAGGSSEVHRPTSRPLTVSASGQFSQRRERGNERSRFGLIHELDRDILPLFADTVLEDLSPTPQTSTSGRPAAPWFQEDDWQIDSLASGKRGNSVKRPSHSSLALKEEGAWDQWSDEDTDEDGEEDEDDDDDDDDSVSVEFGTGVESVSPDSRSARLHRQGGGREGPPWSEVSTSEREAGKAPPGKGRGVVRGGGVDGSGVMGVGEGAGEMALQRPARKGMLMQEWEEQAYLIIQAQKRRRAAAAAEVEASGGASRNVDPNGASSRNSARVQGLLRPVTTPKLQPRSKRKGQLPSLSIPLPPLPLPPLSTPLGPLATGSVSPQRLAAQLVTGPVSPQRLAAELGLDGRCVGLLDYLLSLGIKEADFSKLVARYPAFFSVPALSARERVALLQHLGVEAADLGTMFVRHPALMTYSLESVQAKATWLRALGLSRKHVGRVFVAAPYLLRYPVTALQTRVLYLQKELGVSPQELAKMVARSPQVLTATIAALHLRVRYLREVVGVSPQALVRVVVKHPQVLHYSLEDGIQPRIRFLQRIGIQGDDIATVVARFSQVLSLSVEKNLQPKYEYLTRNLGGGARTVTSFPAYFSLSLEQRIRPRHAFLVRRSKMPLQGPFPMKALAITDAEFASQVARSTLEEYMEFKSGLVKEG